MLVVLEHRNVLYGTVVLVAVIKKRENKVQGKEKEQKHANVSKLTKVMGCMKGS